MPVPAFAANGLSHFWLLISSIGPSGAMQARLPARHQIFE